MAEVTEQQLDDVFSKDTIATAEANPAAPEVEQQTQQEQPEPQQTAPETDDAGLPIEREPAAEPPPEPQHMVPLSELKDERTKRQDLKSQLDKLQEESDARDRQHREMIDRILQQQQQAPQVRQQQEAQPEIDFFDNPEAFIQNMMAPIIQRQQNAELNASENIARQIHGNATVDAALAAVQQAGIQQQFLGKRDPWGEVVQWHKQQQTLAAVGNDPDAFRKQVEEEMRAKIIEEMNSGALPNQTVPVPGAQQRPQPRFPSTLSQQTNAGADRTSAPTPEAALETMFDPNRTDRRFK